MSYFTLTIRRLDAACNELDSTAAMLYQSNRKVEAGELREAIAAAKVVRNRLLAEDHDRDRKQKT